MIPSTRRNKEKKKQTKAWISRERKEIRRRLHRDIDTFISTMSVIEDKQRFSRIISNDSGIYFDQSDDESIHSDGEHTINHDGREMI